MAERRRRRKKKKASGRIRLFMPFLVLSAALFKCTGILPCST